MQVLITTLGSYGDVYPKVAIARELKKRGHAVKLFTNPFFEGLATKYDLDFVPIGTLKQYEQFANHPNLFDSRKGVSIFFDTLIVPGIRSAYESLVQHIETGNTVVVSSITVFAARLVQEKHHIPNATVHVTPMAFKSAYEMPRNGVFPFPDWLPIVLKRLYWWVADKLVVDRMICPELNAFREELGLPPASRVMTRWGHSPELVIGLFPSWYASPQPDWPKSARLTGFPLFTEDEERDVAPDVKAFLEEGESPILFVPGSLMQQAEGFFEAAIMSCQEIGARAIFLSRYEEQIPYPLPDGVRYFKYVPFQHILHRVRALVHHGGIGACALALKAGVPQLIHPMAYDQYDNAWRVKRLGVGDTLNFEDGQISKLTGKLVTLTRSTEVRKRCQAVAERFKGKKPLEETCQLIETLGEE